MLYQVENANKLLFRKQICSVISFFYSEGKRHKKQARGGYLKRDTPLCFFRYGKKMNFIAKINNSAMFVNRFLDCVIRGGKQLAYHRINAREGKRPFDVYRNGV